MVPDPTRARVHTEAAEGWQWELAVRPPSAALAPYVHELQGYVERSSGPLRRRELPGLHVVVILEFEPRLRVYANGQETEHACYAGGFVAGLAGAFTLTEHFGLQAGIQLNLHPLGARRLFGLPLHELRGHTVHFRDLVAPSERGLNEQLAELRDWDARFDRLEHFLWTRLREAAAPNRAVAWALHRIDQAAGAIDLEALAAELGYSRKHMIALFHDQVGVPPKLWARLVRFDRLRRALSAGAPRSWAELAIECGYYDQAHLARDVRQFSGGPPRQLLEGLVPGVLAPPE
jgi:AraC-like DNA-binding protein